MSILEITHKRNKHALIKPTRGVLDLTVLSAKQGIKHKRLTLKDIIKKFLNR
jgi:ribosomal protein L7/L12